MATNTITIKVDFYINWDEMILLTKEEFEERKAREIQDLIDDDSEMEDWMNNNFTAYDLYARGSSDIKAQWKEVCEATWEDNYDYNWTCLTKTIEVKVS